MRLRLAYQTHPNFDVDFLGNSRISRGRKTCTLQPNNCGICYFILFSSIFVDDRVVDLKVQC